jgi:retron-type reverse transcriptase
MTREALEAFVKTRGEELRASLREGSWRPGPLRRGRHLLLVPSLPDRLAFQAILQVLEPLFDKTFSPSSYRRPGRTAEEARERERVYREGGYRYVLCPFLENFVDTVDHRVLLRLIKKAINDPKLGEMLLAILGNRLEGEETKLERGIRQGSCLSALFCNIYLSGLDRELEGRGRRFTRYGDGYRICVGSEVEAREEMVKVAGYAEGKLRLEVNGERSVIEGPGGVVPVKGKATVVIYRKPPVNAQRT